MSEMCAPIIEDSSYSFRNSKLFESFVTVFNKMANCFFHKVDIIRLFNRSGKCNFSIKPN